MSKNQAKECAHEHCNCEIGSNPVESGNKDYCSRGCSVGDGCTHADCNCAEQTKDTHQESSSDGMQGEGNRAADRRYREGVRETVEELGEEEIADKARS